MHHSQSEMRTAPARAPIAEVKKDGHLPNKTSRRLPQLRCEACSKAFDKLAGRRKRFCSDACRKAAERAKDGRNASKVTCNVASGNALNRPFGSMGCKAPSRHPYLLNILGGGTHRWPGAHSIDRATIECIRRREIGGTE